MPVFAVSFSDGFVTMKCVQLETCNMALETRPNVYGDCRKPRQAVVQHVANSVEIQTRYCRVRMHGVNGHIDLLDKGVHHRLGGQSRASHWRSPGSVPEIISGQGDARREHFYFSPSAMSSTLSTHLLSSGLNKRINQAGWCSANPAGFYSADIRLRTQALRRSKVLSCFPAPPYKCRYKCTKHIKRPTNALWFY